MCAESDHLHHHHSRPDLPSSLTWYHHHSRPDHLHSHFNTPQTGLSACTFVPSPTNSIPLPHSREVNYNVNQISRKHTLDLGISPLKTPEWLSISPGTKISFLHYTLWDPVHLSHLSCAGLSPCSVIASHTDLLSVPQRPSAFAWFWVSKCSFSHGTGALVSLTGVTSL